MKSILTRALLVPILLGMAATVWSVEQPLRVVAPHPANDYTPTLSPNGRWLVFASERSGVLNLYSSRFGEGQLVVPIPHLRHPGRTYDSVFSPDGRHLAFVSHRQDALGDIYIQQFPNGRPERVTPRGIVGEAPVFSADGKFLYFRMGPIPQDPVYHAYELGSGTIRKLDGTPPFFPVEPPFPVRAMDVKGSAALLFSEDTNRDGMYGEGDAPALWVLSGGSWKQVSYPIHNAHSFTRKMGKSGFLVSVRRGGGHEIVVIDNPILSPSRTGDELIAEAERFLAYREDGLEQAIALYREGLRRQSPSARSEAAEVRVLQLLFRAGRHWQVSDVGEAFLRQDPAPLHRDRIRVEMLGAKAEAEWVKSRQERRPFRPRPEMMDELQELRQRFQEAGSVVDAGEVVLRISRIQYLAGNHTGALQSLGSLLDGGRDTLPENLLARVSIQKARAFHALGLGSETRSALLGVFRLDITDQGILDEAAFTLIDIVVSHEDSVDSRLLALRNMAVQARQFPHALSRIRLAEADLLRRQGVEGDMEGWRAALTEAAENPAAAPLPAIEATGRLVEDLLVRGELARGLEMARTLEGALETVGGPDRYTGVIHIRERITHHFLETARRQALLGDWPLARATWNDLLQFDPENIEAWRGHIQSISMRPDLLDEAIEKYRVESRKRDASGLSFYKYGLALSYRDALSRRALDAVQRAVAMDGSPYYLLTEGFLHEQRYLVSRDRGRPRNEHLESAMEAYERALSGVNPLRQQQLLADLLLNSGNAALGLGQYARAHDFYTRRQETGISFADPRTEMLYYMNSGIAAYRALYADQAARKFARALDDLQAMEGQDLLPPATIDQVRLELIGRRALALRDRDPGSRESEQLFVKLAGLYPANTLASARAWRNVAFVREYRANALVDREEQRRTLLEARTAGRRALELLAQPNLQVDPVAQRRGALIAFATVIADQGGRSEAFTADEEKILVRGLLARISQSLGERGEAVEQFRLQLAESDRQRALTPYEAAMRSVTTHRLSGESLRMGEKENALRASIDGLRLARVVSRNVEVVDINGATHHLFRLAEILSNDPTVDAVLDRESLWMLEDTADRSLSWNLLGRIARDLLVYQPRGQLEGAPAPAMESPLHHARLLHLAALSEAHQLRVFMEETPVEGVDLLRHLADGIGRAGLIDKKTKEIRTIARTIVQPVELRKLALGSHLLDYQVSVLLAADGEERLSRHGAAVDYAEKSGLAHLVWWVHATMALSEPAGAWQVELLDKSVAALLSAPSRALAGPQAPPWVLLDAAEEAHMRHFLREDDLVGAWTIADKWRVARLAWIGELADPPARTPEERAWVATLQDIRREWRSVQRRLQQFLPDSSSETFALRLQSVRLADRLADHVQSGRDRGLRIADWHAPEPGGFDAAALVFDLPKVDEREPVLVLNRQYPGGSVLAIYHADETEELLGSIEDLPDGGMLYILGNEIPGLHDAVHLLTSLSVTRSTLSMRELDDVVDIPVDGSVPPGLDFAGQIRFSDPLRMVGYSPLTWSIADGGGTLRNVLHSIHDVDRISLSLREEAGYGRLEHEGMRLSLLAFLETIGVTEAIVDGNRWIGTVLEANLHPTEARYAWEEQLGRWMALRDEPPTAMKAVVLERIAYLSEVIGETDDLAAIYGVLADTRGELGQWRSAMRAQERAVDILAESGATSLELAQANGRLGDAATRAGNWPRAFPAYEAASEFAREAGNTELELAILGRMADARELEGDYDTALIMARELAHRYTSLSLDDRIREHLRAARILRVYQSRYQDALDELERADEALLLLSRRIPLLAFEVGINRVRVYQALALFDLAETELEAIGLALDQLRSEGVGEEFARQYAEIALERGNTAWLRSEYRDAFGALQEVSRHLSQGGEMDDIRIAQLNASGLTFWAVNDHARARVELEAALSVAIRLGLPDLIATTHNNIGLVYRSEGKYDEAMKEFNTALDIDRGQGNRWGEAYSLRNMGITLTLAGRPTDAIPPLRDAVRLTRDIGDRLNETKALTALGDALLDAGELGEARTIYQEAEMLAAVTPVPEMHWRSLFGLGRERLASGRDGEALPYLNRAIDIVDFMRASIRIEEFQDGFLLDKQDLYDLTIRTHLDQGDVVAAFEASEKARGRNFIDLLGNRTGLLSAGRDPRDLERAGSLRDRIKSLQADLAAAAIEDREEISGELDRVRLEYEDFMLELRARDPQAASFVRVDPVTVEELQEKLDGETALLVYHILDGEMVLFLLSRDGLEHRRVVVDADTLVGLVARTRVGIQNIENVERELLRLSEFLVEPILPALAPFTRVGIVPHRELHLLPFSALYTGPGENIIDRVALFHTPSASLLRYTMTRERVRRDGARVLSFGNPRLEGGAMDLPFAQKEAERLVFDFDTVTFRTGTEATEAWLRDNIVNYDIIHIASHGEFDPNDPLESALLLAPDGERHDGRLTAADIFGMDIQADLITLSACQTGLGRISVGDDVIGLNRAFVYAGTRQILSTLWRVDDLSTALLFKYFYREIEDHDRAESLRRAQIRLRAQREFQHPAHWASVVLSGDWE